MKRLKCLSWLLAFVLMCGGVWAQQTAPAKAAPTKAAPAKTAPREKSYTNNNKYQKAAPAQIQKNAGKQQQTQGAKKQQITLPVRPWTYANLTRHWEKHGAEFPEYKSEKEYGDGALEFFSHPPEGTLFKTNENHDRLYYHPKTNTFGVTTSTGVPKTLFRPDAGIRYWNRQ